MNKNVFIVIAFIILNVNCYSQISYEEGYYINNSSEKINCLIKNIDWKNNPTKFEYKMSIDDKSQSASIKKVKEFGVNGQSKYIKRNVNIDRSSININQLSNVKKPVFEKEEVFLKVLVEGKAKLYSYESKSLKRYFYSIDISKVKPLVFKKYWASSGKMGTNNEFKQQLWNNIKCEDDKIKEFENIGYKKSDLVKRFLKYNECNNGEAVVFAKQKKDFFNLTLRPGINNSSLSISNSLDDRLSSDFGNELGFRLGVEAEFIMPFNKNKWAIIIEPAYQYFKSEKENTERVFKVDYKTIELPFGIRHYLFLNDDSKFFVNGSYVLGFSYDSTISDNLGSEIDIKSGNNVAFGIGYKYDDKYSVEFKYQTNRTVLRNYLFWDSKYNGLSVILGYTIF